MRSWRLAAGFINGQYATPLPDVLRFVAASIHSTTLGPAVSVDLPDYKAGDLLIACAMYRNPITIPSGWTVVASTAFTNGGQPQTTLMLKRIATADKAAGPEGFTINAVNGNVGRLSLQVLVFRSPEALDVVDFATNAVNDTLDTTFAAPLKAVNGQQIAVSTASSYLQNTSPPFSMSVSSPFIQTSSLDTSDSTNQIRLGVGYSSIGTPAASFTLPSTVTGSSWGAITALIGKPLGGDTAYFNDFETDSHGFTGSWARTTKWAKSGNYSLGSTNQGVPSSDNVANLPLSLSGPAFLIFDGYVEGEPGSDGLRVTVDDVLWTNDDIQVTGANGGSISSNGLLAATSSGGVAFSCRKFLSQRNQNVAFINHKDSSVDAGLDGSFIDNVKIEKIDARTPSNAYYFWDFEQDHAGVAGTWDLTAEWSFTGSKSLGRTNKGVQGSTTSANVVTNVDADAVVEFFFYTQGENNYDGLQLTLNDAGWSASDITNIQGNYTVNSSNILTSPNGFVGKFSRRVPAGTVSFLISYIKDSSGDVGLDGGFIDRLVIFPMPANYRRLIGLHFNGENLSTNIVDTTGRQWTADNGINISTDQSVFGGASLRTRVTSRPNTIRTPYKPDLVLKGDYSVKARLYPMKLPSGQEGTALVFFARDTGARRSYSFRLTVGLDGNISGIQAVLFLSPTNYVTFSSSVNIPYEQWCDVEISRAGANTYIFYNGTSVAVSQGGNAGNAQTNPYTDDQFGATIGGDDNTSGYERFNGYIDEFEFYNRAIHTNSYSVPTTPFTD